MRRPGYLAGWQAMTPRTFGDFGSRSHSGGHLRSASLAWNAEVERGRVIQESSSPPPAPTGPAGGFSKGAR